MFLTFHNSFLIMLNAVMLIKYCVWMGYLYKTLLVYDLSTVLILTVKSLHISIALIYTTGYMIVELLRV